jgi:hypothetical protein
MVSRCLSFLMVALSSLVVPRRSTAEALEIRAEFLNELLLQLGVATGSHSFATRGFLVGAGNALVTSGGGATKEFIEGVTGEEFDDAPCLPASTISRPT